CCIVSSYSPLLIIRPLPKSTLFPTRRSSDLDKQFPAVIGYSQAHRTRIGRQENLLDELSLAAVENMHHSARFGRYKGLQPARSRSEEHTSELQSLRHLV